jgi:hypothetical protein
MPTHGKCSNVSYACCADPLADLRGHGVAEPVDLVAGAAPDDELALVSAKSTSNPQPRPTSWAAIIRK